MGGKPRPLKLGWREWVMLPELTEVAVKAKVDTGARTSSLHAENIRIVRRGDERLARFFLVPRANSRRGAQEVIAPLVGKREVRSSNGLIERRVVVSVKVELGGRRRRIDVTLTDRDQMGFRMLLGRQAIRRLKASVNPLLSFNLGDKPHPPD